MKYRIAVLAFGLLGTLLACSQSDPAADAETTPPNILFIVADDLGFTDLGAFGSEIATPNLDRLAHAGLRLNNLHAASACRPTRLMLMASAGASAANRPVPEAARGGVLNLNYAIIPELLQDAGYATYITG